MMTFLAKISVVQSRSSLGDITSSVTEYPCYIQESIQAITTSLGKETVSSVQIFFMGEDILKIAIDALITVGTLVRDEQTQKDVFLPLYSDKPILRRQVYYAAKGRADLGVLYLP